MTHIKSYNSLLVNADNLKILNDKEFYFIDINVKEKLTKKDLKSFLKYKIIQEFNLDENKFDYFYLNNAIENDYQVYSVKKSIFSKNNKKIITPKNLAYRNLSILNTKQYYLLLIEKNQSSIMLYINGFLIFSNYVSFKQEDLNDDNKIQELSLFINNLTKLTNQNMQTSQNVRNLYVYIKQDFYNITKDNLAKDILDFEYIYILKNEDIYKSIDINLQKARKIYTSYPLSFSLGISIFLSFLFSLLGYVALNMHSNIIQNDTKKLQIFFNKTNKDAKEHYILQDNFTDINKTLLSKKLQYAKLIDHTRKYDLTDVLVNVLLNVKKYDVYLKSVELKNINKKRFVYVNVMFNNKEKVKKYIKSSPDYFIEKIGKDGDMLTYLIKAEIK